MRFGPSITRTVRTARYLILKMGQSARYAWVGAKLGWKHPSSRWVTSRPAGMMGAGSKPAYPTPTGAMVMVTYSQ